MSSVEEKNIGKEQEHMESVGCSINDNSESLIKLLLGSDSNKWEYIGGEAFLRRGNNIFRAVLYVEMLDNAHPEDLEEIEGENFPEDYFKEPQLYVEGLILLSHNENTGASMEKIFSLALYDSNLTFLKCTTEFIPMFTLGIPELYVISNTLGDHISRWLNILSPVEKQKFVSNTNSTLGLF